MPDKNGAKKKLPPYVPFKTLFNFFDGLKITTPPKIDRSLMESMSGSLQSHVILALEYLGLTERDGTTTEMLNRIVHAEGEERREILKEILTDSYPFLFQGEFQLDRATDRQFREAFEQTGVTGDTARKAIVFFIKAAKAAGVRLSPHINVRTRSSGTKKRNSEPRRKVTLDSSGTQGTEQGKETTPQEGRKTEEPSFSNDRFLLDKLIGKFPEFNPEWTPEVQAKWFDGIQHFREDLKETRKK